LMRESSRGAAGCGAASEDLAAPVALCGAMALGGGELQREDRRLRGFGCARSSEGRWRRRCAMEEGEEPSLPSLKGGREGAVSEMLPLMRRFENARYSTHYARSPRRFASPTARVPRAHDLRIFTWSSDYTVDACHWRAQQLLGAPGPSPPQEGTFAGRAPGGYCRCSGYRGIPVHLLLGLFNSAASAQG
jgi:hypothetical protein